MSTGSNESVSPQEPPPGWGKDKLSEFLEHVRDNQFATFANKKAQYAKLRELDDCFYLIANNLINAKAMIPALLLLRAHSVFRVACGLSMAGQATEAFIAIRSCLEYAGYAILMNQDASFPEIWLRRHDNDDAMKAMKKVFSFRAIVDAVAAKDRKLAELYEKQYQTAIDFGAHPNERAITGSLAINTDLEAKQKLFMQTYLNGDGIALEHSLKETARVGLCALFVFANVFPERFALLGIAEKIQALRNGL